ncbi:hypothetical protein [Thermococcus sp.]|uniref:hypothetical protein n=1 Tax=Thermococcus sp. TaxID=35749 RepID=UPI0026299B89|nr:hypothetical protein [Thermococcus sp.]
MSWWEPEPLEDFEERLANRIIIQLLEEGYPLEEAEAVAWKRVEKVHLELIKEE